MSHPDFLIEYVRPSYMMDEDDYDVIVTHRDCGGAGFLDGDQEPHCPFCDDVEPCEACGEHAVPKPTATAPEQDSYCVGCRADWYRERDEVEAARVDEHSRMNRQQLIDATRNACAGMGLDYCDTTRAFALTRYPHDSHPVRRMTTNNWRALVWLLWRRRGARSAA